MSVYPGYPVSVVKENGPFSLAAVVFFAWNFKCYISDNSYSRLIFFFLGREKGRCKVICLASCGRIKDKRMKKVSGKAGCNSYCLDVKIKTSNMSFFILVFSLIDCVNTARS